MAKMFYTLDEAAARLGSSEDDVRKLIDSGQLQEFRDQDRVMLKVEQVDLLASGDGDEDAHIPLAESGELDAIDLASSGSGSALDLEDPKERTGVSIFDADETEEADPSAVTHVHGAAQDFPGDLSSSGSGLMDLTREADDTSLGGDALLEGMYAEETAVDQTVVTSEGELFESSPEQETHAGPAGAIAVGETYDPVWSGVLGGAALAAIVVLGATIVVVLGAMVTNSPAAPLVTMVRDNYMAVVGGMGALAIVCMIVGLLLGKATA